MKRVMILLALVLSLGVVLTACSKARTVETDKLSASFASASAEVKAEIQKALGGIKAKDYMTALTALKKVADGGALSADQKRALGDSVTDITVILTENPPANADALFELVEGINEKL